MIWWSSGLAVAALLLVVLRALEVEIKQHHLRAMVAEPGVPSQQPTVAKAADPPVATTALWSFRRPASRAALRFRLQGIPRAFAACQGGTQQLCAEAREQFATVPAPTPDALRACAVAGVGGDLLQASPGFL